MKKIIVGFLMSYDYEKLKQSIPAVYGESDKIYLALDYEYRTWKGNTFTVSQNFFQWLKDIDVDGKIEIYRDDFYKPELSTIENDTRERYMLSLKMGEGNWFIQVDADEIFIDFKQFVDTLKSHNHFLEKPEANPVQIAGFLINIYKYLEDGLLYVDEPTKVMLATNYPNYKRARNTKERIIYTNNVLLHECLSRSEEELKFKLENWGHSHQINKSFFSKWKMADKTNFKSINNVFYLDASVWKSLDYFPTTNLIEIKSLVQNNSKLHPSKWFLLRKNFGQWFKFLGPFKKSNTTFESYFKE
ncbi:hypothetical protein [Bizionia paragorgiae]|uniref:Glycosyl transferase family 2 n=1 Tax=Bizionia paragorgiae TaxID=283786 RepID=A0A1H3VG91_BIZPA|nr:hypothetical protein [Bizionia paragorgiae]SDZ73779.1 hypothetical protein SAMN04487990_101135 [Bizionia paragorgiae]